MYRLLIRPILYLLPAETAHHVAFGFLRLLARIPGVKRLLRMIFGIREPALRVSLPGMELSNPIGLAAGFDKDAVGYEALGAFGFGFVEIGTVTGEPQPGNPKPRLFRLPKDRALINRMGFNNRGSLEAAQRLARPRRTIVGVNIGKTKTVAEVDAIDDYVKSATRLAPHADYMVVNVSSPNTPGLRDLQAVEKLRPLLVAVRNAVVATGHDLPLFVKIAPDLADEDIDRVADLAVDLGLFGIIATNTTIARGKLETSASQVERIGAGGLSGAPLHDRSLAVLRRLRTRVGERLVLISVGGIERADQVWERIQAGATLVQIYTSFIYEGPLLPRRLCRGLAQSVRRAGLSSVQDAVGRGQN